MKSDSHTALLKDIPQTQSYTPSAFLKGFIPTVIVESSRRTSSLGSHHKKNKTLSPDITSALKKTIESVSLYRNTLPPELKTVLIRNSERSNTIKMFRSKFDNMKGIDLITPSGPGSKKVLITNKIFRRDSLKTVKYLLNRTDQQQKDKLKGSMYVNELWSKGFEKCVMEATNIDSDLKQEYVDHHRPLGEKFEGINKIFSKKQRYDGVDENLENFKSRKSLAVQISMERTNSLREPDTQLLGLQTTKSLLISTTPTRQRDLVRTSVGNLRAKKTRAVSSLGNIVLIPRNPNEKDHIFNNIQNCKEESREGWRKKSANTFQSFKNMNIKDEEYDNSLSELRDEFYIRNPLDSPVSLNKGLSSPASTATSFAINRQKWRERQRGMSVDIKDGSTFCLGKSGPPSPSLNTSQRSLKKTLSMSFCKKTSDMSRDNIAVMNLIEQCDSELEDKEQYFGMLNHLKGRLTQNKAVNWKFVEANRKKQTMIGDLKYMLEKRDAILGNR